MHDEGSYKEYKCFVLMSAITEMIDEQIDYLVFKGEDVKKRGEWETVDMGESASLMVHTPTHIIKGHHDIPPVLPIGNLSLKKVIEYTKTECPHHYLTKDIDKGYNDIIELGYKDVGG